MECTYSQVAQTPKIDFSVYFLIALQEATYY